MLQLREFKRMHNAFSFFFFESFIIIRCSSMDIWQQGLEEWLIKFIKNPSDLSSTQEMYKIFSQDESFKQAAENSLLKNENFKKLYEEGSMPSSIDLSELIQLPENTLGYQYAHHMKKNNLQLDFISEFKNGKSVLSYLWARAKYIHDMGHLLTGFDTTLFGEISIKGFEVAQYSSPSSAATSAAGLFSLVCLMPDKTQQVFAAFIKGYNVGLQFPLLMAIKWEEEWQTPIEEVRRKYKIPLIA